MHGQLDDAVEAAWREFRQRLADHVAEMAEGDSIVVELRQPQENGAAPYCQVAGSTGMVRVEAVSNVYLAVEHELDEAQERALERLGFHRPEAEDWSEDETNFWIDLEPREADRAAVMIVRALHEVYGVLHPVYLEAGGLEPEAAAQQTPASSDPDPDQVVRPSSVDEVREVVDRAVAGLYDEAPAWDSDGDLPLVTEHNVLWVSVNNASPRILLHCCLLGDVTDTAVALEEVNRRNQTEFGLTFVLREGRISVTREICVEAVTLRAVTAEAERLLGQVDQWAGEIATALAPRRDQDRAKTPSRFGTAYAVMVELERAQRGSVEPATMARIFHHDTGLLLKAIRITEQRRREVRSKVRRAKDEGRHRDEQVARARQEYMRELTARMRAALRLIVDAPVRKVQLDQLALFDEDEAGTGR
ncbi:hypothetical protein NYO98_11065 [Nocardioides sp. STR2]|uniref:Sensory transduction regulator n=1 Tax=Nocardioides pini TaxID=2975053 RepID=A0ABT4CCY6_9ACTN|nr:hypothetical protein [Nocardioides pini]MCY4726817.1 hypothetical protein [Nocardioides pini]